MLRKCYRLIIKGLTGICVPRNRRAYVRHLLLDGGILKVVKVWYQMHHQPTTFPYTLSLTMCVKDEGRYLKEWIEYYLLQGVEHFYLYNNNGTDNSQDILAPYIQSGLVTWHEYPGYKKQKEIYNHAIDTYKNETKWMGFVDADEFIVPMQDPDLKTALLRYQGASQVLVRWILFGSSGHKTYTDGLVIERFKYRSAGVSEIPKCLLNPRSVVYMVVHSAVVLGKTVNEQGMPVPDTHTGPITADILRCHHYVVKSVEEYLRKKNRWKIEQEQQGQQVYHVVDDTYFTQHDQNDVKDDTMDHFVPLLRERV